MEEVSIIPCGACGSENEIVPKPRKQYNPKAILFICRSCGIRNLRDGTVIPLEKGGVLPNIQVREKPKAIQGKEEDEPKSEGPMDVALVILGVIAAALGLKALGNYLQGRGRG
ncbi:MAG: hypothetical protein ISS89_05385 [Candidatus Omnitrophica bacterium]|nr:hypothetical protein [Candidatus Omnitrophota bacterium]